jgi:tight adherence protein B
VPVALTFLTVAAVIVGAYWLFVGQAEDRQSAALRSRLRPEARPKASIKKKQGLLKEVQRLSEINVVEAILQKSGNILSPLQQLIAQTGRNSSVGTVLLTCVAVGMSAVATVYALTRIWLIALPVGALAMTLPIFVLRYQRDRRVLKFEEQFPEAIDLIARALRAGHAFTTGLSMVADEVEAPVGLEFRILFERQNFGMPLPEAMREFAQRIPILDAKFFATAVLTQRESGGNLAEILDNLSSVIRERFRVKRQVRVISAHGRLTGWVLSLFPPGLAVAFMVLSPGHLDRMLRDTLGIQMILGALALQFIGMMAIRKIVRIEY